MPAPALNATDPTARGADPSRRWFVATTAGAVASAFLASLCCIGPLVLAVLGLGGAGLLVKFEPYRPHFAALTAALLGTGFYFSYRRPRRPAVAGRPDCACEEPRSSRVGKAMLWLATALVVGFLAFPYIAAHWFG